MAQFLLIRNSSTLSMCNILPSQEGVGLCPLQQCQDGEDMCFCLFLLFQLTKEQILLIEGEGARLRMCSVQECWLSPREMSLLLGY